jgi:caspase domain-containing protein/concanavalin A-like lectin/glucanase superfamily protein
MRLQLIKLITLTYLLVLLIPNNSNSAQERRIALVIGNGAYKSSPLVNPANDANDMAATLKKCKFRVLKSINASRKEMRRVIREFGKEINKGAVGLFYYAGHGIQVNGENYLVPINAEVYTESEVEDECLKVSSVLRQMESAGNRLNIIILDACRDNPFGRSFRSNNMGLAKMDAPTGSILAYATAPGSIAADGTGGNGLYTSMLLKHMTEPNLAIERVFKRVRIDVVNASGNRQTPWESSSLMGDFYFNTKRGIVVKKRPTVKPKKPAEELPKYTSISPEISKPKFNDRRLAAYYPFNGNANDDSGNGQHGIEYGGVRYKKGKIGKAIYFDGIKGYVKTSYHPVFNKEDPFTISMWVKGEKQQAAFGIIFGFKRAHKSGIAILNGNRDKYKYFNIFDENAEKSNCYYKTNISDGFWHHLVAVRNTDSNSVKLFIDGKLESNIRDHTSRINTSGSRWLAIGARNHESHGPSSFFKGAVDEVKIFHKALSEAEIRQLYNSP